MNQFKYIQKEYIKESNLILSKKGKTFFWAKFFLSKKHARRAIRLYRFCRYIDDIGDDSKDKQIAEKMLEQVIQQIKTGVSAHPIIQDAILLFIEFKIDKTIPILLIEGVVSDLKSVRFNTEAELMIYCYKVAGTVGLMMCKLLDVTDNRALLHAIDLGIAMQITNICRDVKEDAYLNRRYLPASIIGDIEPGLLIHPDPKIQQNITSAIAKLLNIANQYYESSKSGLCFLPIRARMCVIVASALYRYIGEILKEKNYSYWTFRSSVSNRKKLSLSLMVLVKALTDSDFYKYSSTHQTDLHQHIKEHIHLDR
jgi:15-cis-phytoene synthase